MDADLGRAFEQAVEQVSGWVEGLVRSLPDLVAALLVLLLFWGAAALARNALLRLLERISEHRSVNRLLSTVVYGAVLAVGFFAALGVLDLDRTVTSLLAGAGIVALALGFAFQDTAENFISGVLLAFRRPYREGEVVETNDHMGVVEEINLRSTRPGSRFPSRSAPSTSAWSEDAACPRRRRSSAAARTRKLRVP